MSQPLSVQDAIRQSATDVDLEELSRRGLRKVKVLDKQTVFRLIDEAVNRVVEERLALATDAERQQIQSEARSEFQRLVKERQQEVEQTVEQKVQAAKAAALAQMEQVQAQARAQAEAKTRAEMAAEVDERVGAYEAKIRELESQVAAQVEKGNVPGTAEVDPIQLGEMIRQAVAEAAPVAPQGGSNEIAALAKSIESLSKKVGNSGGSNSSSQSAEAPSEEALQAFFSRSSVSDGVESNISNVEVKNAKANGVNKNLAKLRSLKKGSE